MGGNSSTVFITHIICVYFNSSPRNNAGNVALPKRKFTEKVCNCSTDIMLAFWHHLIFFNFINVIADFNNSI